MNATFETIRGELKKYNAEDNEAPPKLLVAGKNAFLDIEHKRKRDSQFVIGVKDKVNWTQIIKKKIKIRFITSSSHQSQKRIKKKIQILPT